LSFVKVQALYRDFDFESRLRDVSEGKVDAILAKERISEEEFLSLLSPNARCRLEQMARKAEAITKRHFGRVITLFTPMYISNFCDNACAYCSFARQRSIVRRHLSFDEIREESRRISKSGLRHILVLTGESRSRASPSYLSESIRIIKEHFSSIGIETYPLKEDEYQLLINQGVDGLTIFQETYEESAYHCFHRGGPKDDFQFRLEAPDRACRQGMRTVSIGALMGLATIQRDAFFTGLHARYLQKTYPRTEVSISFPRIRPLAGEFSIPFPVSDALFVQIIAAMRIFLVSAGITISTRESKQLRNALLPLGVTKMSAGVSTAVGGHSEAQSTTQFEIADFRSVEEMKTDLLSLGYQPVMQDWDSHFLSY
jgi:2-iminoacetate synthase